MGELFERGVPATPLDWTGERLTTAVSGQAEIEHLHRYFFARELCRGLDVLDVASGEGYGAALLAQTARSVAGVDLSAAAVEHARMAYAPAFTDDRLRFLQGDARRLPLPDGSVDAVVSFETIEHFGEQDAFVAEVRRVLRPGGRFVVSSPERDSYSPSGSRPNPFHVRELTRAEFAGLLEGAFRHVAIFGQRPLLGTVLVPERPVPTAAPWLTFERRSSTRFEASSGLARPLYLVAVASDAPVSSDLGAGSLYIESSDVEGLMSRAAAGNGQAELRRQSEELRRRVEELQRQLSAQTDASEAARHERSRFGEEAERWRAELLDQAREAAASQLRSERLENQAEDRLRQLLEANRTVEVLRGEVDRSAEEAAGKEAAFRALLSRASYHETALNDVYRSLSWRIGGPWRGWASRHPALAGAFSRLFDRHPGRPGEAWLAARRAWRLLTLRPQPPASEPQAAAVDASAPPPLLPAPTSPAPTSPAPPPETSALETSAPPAPCGPEAAPPPPPAGATPRKWIFVGDTFDWLRHHRHVSGVGRVTTELVFAALGEPAADRMLPCVLGADGLAAVSLRDCVTFLAARVGTRPAAALLAGLDAVPPQAEPPPGPGDHVLFTGAVWTAHYAELFRRLARNGIGFSVLVYDAIPLQGADFITPDHAAGFADWLTTVLSLASQVYVSGPSVRDDILRWAALSAVPVAASVAPVEFGSTRQPRSEPRSQPRYGADAGSSLASVRRDAFVLCVGTVDRRKNQPMLGRVWQRLISELGREAVPQLVLAGRDDLGLSSMPGGIAQLVATGDVAVLDELDDDALASLYESCLLTVFPSLAEGYGLPVAESLAYGKPCVASDLPVVREHAGDLPWYVPPGDEEATYAAIRRAVVDADARADAAARIVREYHPLSWAPAYRTMLSGTARPANSAPPAEHRPVVAGLAPVSVPVALAEARRWCTDEDPEVSIIIVNWNAAALTRECIRHVWANTGGVRYEILVADNSAEPASGAVLGSGVRWLELGINRFFGEANNIAAERASGRYVCFLNNDAFVEPGWLQALVDTLAADPSAGAAGPLFLFPDGTIGEAGGHMDAGGYPVRTARGTTPGASGPLLPGPVDYVSAATLLMPRDLFLRAGGFDLAYEPAYYEDVDLCFRLRAMGRPVRFCPGARVIHIEGAAANDDPAARARRDALGDLNRAKFVARWGGQLRGGPPHGQHPPAPAPAPAPRVPARPNAPRRTAALFTPYALTPGGGERVVLTMAAVLGETHAVTLVTPHPYSRLRLLALGRIFGLDLEECAIVTQAEFAQAPGPDLFIAMGNHILPPVPACGGDNLFLCQFPFPPLAGSLAGSLAGKQPVAEDFEGYRAVLVYSDYAGAHVTAAMSAAQLPDRPVEVIHPPVPQLTGSVERKKAMILSVGRFFGGGHGKRHDALIAAFRTVLERSTGPVELHFAGSSVPDAAHLDHLDELQRLAEGLPVTFHVNASQEVLAGLYCDAAIYWHAMGYGADLLREPGAAEHFGVAVLEAMSAQCVPMALNSGGPREIITHGTDGFLYRSLEQLAATTVDLLSPGSAALRRTMGRAAGERARAFAPDAFAARVREVVRTEPDRTAVRA